METLTKIKRIVEDIDYKVVESITSTHSRIIIINRAERINAFKKNKK